MRTRWFPCLPLLALFALPAVASAQGKADDRPTLVVRVRSLDTLFETGKLLANLAGKGEILKQLEDLLKSKIGPKGLAALDTRRPFGLYAQVGKDLSDLRAVLLIPLKDQAGFLTMLDSLDFKAEKDKNDLYTVKQKVFPLDIYLRFANKYAYVTALNPEAVAKDALLDPAKLFPASQKSALSVTLRLDQVPNAAKMILLQHVEAELGKLIEKRDKGEGEAQHAFKGALIRELGKQLVAAVRDGTNLHADVDVDPKAGTLSAEVTLGAKPGSALAKTVEKLGQSRSLFGALLRDDAALNVLVHYEMPEKLRAALGLLVNDAKTKALAQISDEAKRKQVLQVIDALAPTFKEGEIDLAVSLRGPEVGNRHTLIAGLRLKDGEKVAQTLRELLKGLPESERSKIKLDVEKVGGVAIHSLDLTPGYDAKTKAVFGEGPMFVAFRPDSVLLAVGDGGLTAIKSALTAAPVTTAPLRFEISISRLAAVLAQNEEQAQAARKALALNEDARVRIAVEGGTQLRIRFQMSLAVIRVLTQLSEAQSAKKAEK